jgi:hypothetical protein
MFAVNVKGGTGAGRKRPLRDKPQEWRCNCRWESGHETPDIARKPGYLARCTDCGTARDGQR